MATVKQAKLFVGGISHETTEETLTKHFCRYGEIMKSEVLRYETGFGRGFGFVTFVDSSVVDKVLQDQHIILGRTVDVKWARPKGEKSETQQEKYHSKKIFVGGLPDDISEEDLKKYFEAFGRIEDATILYNKETKNSRGFGFIIYDSEEAATSSLGFHILNKKRVEVKQAKLREKRATDIFNIYSFYPIYAADCRWCPNYGMYPPHYHWATYNMMPPRIIYPGTNMSVSQHAPTQCFMPRGPVACCASTQNGASNWGSFDALSNASCNDLGSHKSISHEGNVQDCKIGVQLAGKVPPRGSDQDGNIEDQLVGKVSPRAARSTKSSESEAINGEKDNSEKSLLVNVEKEDGEKDKGDNSSASISSMVGLANGEKDNITEIFQDNTEKENGEKDEDNNNCVSPNMLGSANGEKDDITGNSQVNFET